MKTNWPRWQVVKEFPTKKSGQRTTWLPLQGPPAVSGALRQELERQLAVQKHAKVATLGQESVDEVIGLAKRVGTTAYETRRSYGELARLLTLKNLNVLQLSKMPADKFKAAVVGFSQGLYRFDRYKSKSEQEAHTVQVLGLSAAQKKDFHEALVMAEAVHLCRDLVNTPAEDMGPDQFEKIALKVAKDCGLKAQVMNAAACKKNKMGALLGVGRASHRPPRLLIVEWSGRGRGRRKDFLALCGKGVCFDTGGLDIKPAQAMLLMRKDMGGAATVLAAMQALARLQGRRRVRAYIPLVENAIAAEAFRPGDILTVNDGQTVEVGHTDAEGRLVLADAMAWACKEGASEILTVATLTGAAMVALGRIHVPIMGDRQLTTALEKAAKKTGEKVWRLPMDEEHRALVRGKVADLTNSDGSGEAGCITAGAFLSHFAGDRPFAHCDISPASWKPAPHALGPAGATGVLVTTLVEALRV